MERLLQYWDDLDDLFWAVAALRPRIVESLFVVGGIGATVVLSASLIQLAMQAPMPGLAGALLLAMPLAESPALTWRRVRTAHRA